MWCKLGKKLQQCWYGSRHRVIAARRLLPGKSIMFRQEQERIASSSAVSKDSGTAGAVLLTVMHVEPTRFVSQLAALVLVLADGLTLRSSRNCIATPSTWQKNLPILPADRRRVVKGKRGSYR